MTLPGSISMVSWYGSETLLIWFRSLPGDQDPCWEKNLLDLLRPDLVQDLTWSSGSVLRKETTPPSPPWPGSGPYLGFRIHVENRSCSTFSVLICSVSDPYHFVSDPDPDPRIRIRDDGSGSEVTFDSVNRIFPIKCYARL